MVAIDEWKKIFEERIGGDIFEIAESAILVAGWYYPEEFFRRRDRMAQILFAKQNPPRRLRVYSSYSVDDEIEEEEGSDHVSVDDEIEEEGGSDHVSVDDEIEEEGGSGHVSVDDEIKEEEGSDHVSASASPLLVNNGGGSETEIHHNNLLEEDITRTKDDEVAIGGVVGHGDGTTHRRRHIIPINLKHYKENRARLAQAAEEEEEKKLQLQAPKKKEISKEQLSIAVHRDDKQGQVLNLNTKSPKENLPLPVPEKKEEKILDAPMKKKSDETVIETTCRRRIGMMKGGRGKTMSLCGATKKKEIREEEHLSIAVVRDDKQWQVLKPIASKPQKEYLPVPEKKKGEQALDALARATVKKNTGKTVTETTSGMKKGEGQKFMSMCPFESSKFEATKRKFQQEYKEIEDAKKKIRIIEFKDLPQQQQQRQKQKPAGFGFGCSNNRGKLGGFGCANNCGKLGGFGYSNNRGKAGQHFGRSNMVL